MSSVHVRHLDAFARGPGGGNPCPIVLDADGLSAQQMQSVAAHYGHESGFVLRDDDGSLRLRYFVPRHEMSMCVHATVAAMTVLAAEGRFDAGSLTVRTASGDCKVSRDLGDPPMVTVEQQTPVIGAAADDTREVERAAGLPPRAVDDGLPTRPVSVSRAKLVVPVRRTTDVHAAEPDLPALWALCRRFETTGAYLYAPHPEGDRFVARQFPVDAGYPEDPATGVAAGALAVHLADLGRPATAGWRAFEIDQGDAMGRPSRLRAAAYVDGAGVHRSTVTGSAVARGEEDLDLASLPR